MSKRKREETMNPNKTKTACKDCDENVVLLLDVCIGSEDLKMKIFCDSMIVSFLASDECRDLIEHFGQQVVTDNFILGLLRRRMKRNVWGEHLRVFSIRNDILGMANNKLFVLDNLHQIRYDDLSDELKNDQDIINAVVKRLDPIFDRINKDNAKIRNFAMSAMDFNRDFYLECIKHWCADKDFMLKAIEKSEIFTSYDYDSVDEFAYFLETTVPKEILFDKEFGMECYKRNIFDDNSECYRNFENEIEEFERAKSNISRKSNNFSLSDEDLLLNQLAENKDIFTKAPFELRSDKSFLMKAAKRRTMPEFIFKYMPLSLRSDKELMIEALKSNKKAVKYVCGKLTADKDILLLALTKTIESVMFLTEELRNDRDFILKAINVNPAVLLHSYFITDKHIVKEAIKKDATLWPYIPENFKQDKEVLFCAITNNPSVLEQFPEISKEFIMSAIEINPLSLMYAPPLFKGDTDLMLKAVECGILSKEFLPFDLILPDSLFDRVMTFDLRSILLYPHSYCSFKVENLLMLNLQRKLRGNLRYCKYILSQLDFKQYE